MSWGQDGYNLYYECLRKTAFKRPTSPTICRPDAKAYGRAGVFEGWGFGAPLVLGLRRSMRRGPASGVSVPPTKLTRNHEYEGRFTRPRLRPEAA